MLNLARCDGSTFVLPNGHIVGGELLRLNFKRTESENVTKLNAEAEVFGYTFFGDSVTVKRMPLFNALALSAKMSPVVLEIHDCTEHMAAGGKKDAPYIAEIFLNHLTSLDKNKTFTDLIFFDGASNVQKAGKIIEAKFPRVNYLHGAEHCVALWFTDLSKMGEIKVSILPPVAV